MKKHITIGLVSILLIGLGIFTLQHQSSSAFDLGLFLMLFGGFHPIILGDFWDKVFDGKTNNPTE